MDSESPTYRDFARWAQMTLDEIARDCDVQVFRASGPGGQCVNTTDSAVRMVHGPSGIAVTSRESRSQFEAKARPPKVRRATKPSRRAREARLADKHRRAQVKAQRRPVDGE